MRSMYTATIMAADSGNIHHDTPVATDPVVASYDIKMKIAALVGDQSVDVYRLESVYDSDSDEVTGWMEDFQGGPVRLWRELSDLRDRVDMHPTAIMGGETYAVCNREHGNRLLIVMVDWYQNFG